MHIRELGEAEARVALLQGEWERLTEAERRAQAAITERDVGLQKAEDECAELQELIQVCGCFVVEDVEE